MASGFLQEIGLADDVLVDEQGIPAPAPAPPDARLLRDPSARRTLPSDIRSSCLVSSTYFSQTLTTYMSPFNQLLKNSNLEFKYMHSNLEHFERSDSKLYIPIIFIRQMEYFERLVSEHCSLIYFDDITF